MQLINLQVTLDRKYHIKNQFIQGSMKGSEGLLAVEFSSEDTQFLLLNLFVYLQP